MSNQDICERVSAVIDKAVTDGKLVGSVVLISRHGDDFYRRAAGYADREAGRVMREDSIMRYASLSKPIISAACMAMIERGLLTLEDTAHQWLPEFQPANPDGSRATITVRHLLTHTSGLSYGFFQPDDGPYRSVGISDGIDRVPDEGFPMEKELRLLSSVPLFSQPGSEWGYSLSTDVLGEILARAAGGTLEDVVARYVTRPLGMKDTGFTVHDPARLAVAYADSIEGPARPMTDPDIVPLPDIPQIRYYFSPSRVFRKDAFLSGGGGMVGTANDFMIFLEALREGGRDMLTPASVAAMRSNQIGDLRTNTELTPSWGFGFGGAVLMDREMAGTPHANGTWKWGGVYGHHWFMNPETGITLAALSNTAVAGMTGKIINDLVAAVYA